MIERYKLYRSYGHGIITSAIYAPTTLQLLAASIIIGFIVGAIIG